MAKPRGLPSSVRMRHDEHYVEALTSSAGSPIGRLVKIDEIDPNPNQPRQVMGDLSELMASIAEKGIIEPIIVRQRGGRFQIVAGERRYQAAVQVGLRDVPIIGSWFVFAALIVLAVPPMVTNAYVAMAEVPDEVRDAARGMGLTETQALLRVELPIAVPLVMGGIRTAAVQVVATATIAAQVGSGGLGRYIVEGFALGRSANDEVFAGALLVAAFALATELVFALLQRAVTPAALPAADSGDPEAPSVVRHPKQRMALKPA